MTSALDPPRLSDRVYKEVRNAILDGTFRPNQRLVETRLAEWLQLSRTPVREGLQRLVSDGLIRAEPHGWIVHEHTLHEIEDIYHVRAALEGYAAQLATPQISTMRIGEIERLLQPPRGATWESLSPEEVVRTNEAFHHAIMEPCKNSRLLETIARNKEFHFNYHVAQAYTSEQLDRAMEEHAQILEAVRHGDRGGVEMLVRRHIIDSLEVLASARFPRQ